MWKQQTFAGLAWKNKGKKTRREQFLSEMNQIIPWTGLIELIERYYPKAGRGRQPLGLEKMLRIYLFADLVRSVGPTGGRLDLRQSMRRFAGVELSDDVVPDETTICSRSTV